MYTVLLVCFIILLLLQKKNNSGYTLLVLLQIASLLMAPFVCHGIQSTSLVTFVNIIYVCLNLYLIITPWRGASFQHVVVNAGKIQSFTKILRIVLTILILLNLVVFAVVIIFIPDISQFKNEQAFMQLYESIPYFSIVFRVTAVTQYFGLIAIPISCYFLHLNNRKMALRYFVLSLSTLTSALALYSRAGILTYFLTCIGFYLLSFSLFDQQMVMRLKKYIRNSGLLIGGIFLTITIVRFTAMDYYGDRIPNESYIKNPIAYNIFDYASQGFSNGIEQLDRHTSDDIVWGTHSFYNISQMLAFFGIINWSSDVALAKLQKTYDKNGVGVENDSGAFHGYVCTLVKDFGFFLTFLLNLGYFCYVSGRCKKRVITIDNYIVLVFLFVQPCVSVFYSSIGELFLPLGFYFFIKHLIR